MLGYGTAVVTSVGISLAMRKLTAGLITGKPGNLFLAVNLLVNATAASAANVANTLSIRSSEMKKGIKVYEDRKLTKEAGVSVACGKEAVKLTAISRGALAIICMSIPICLMMLLNMLSRNPMPK